MAYRKIERPRPVRRVLQDTATKNRTYVQNGATANLAVPCWYMEVRHPQHTHLHDREWHDHIGWPDPQHPDASCQDAYHLRTAPFRACPDGPGTKGWRSFHRYLDLSTCFPVHLEEEGYSEVEVAFADKPQGLSGHGEIDDFVVRFTLAPMCPDAVKKDLDVPYTVFVTGTVAGRAARDVVSRGTLRIVAGPIA